MTRRIRRLLEEWEADDEVRRLGPRPLPAVLLAVLAALSACAVQAPQEPPDADPPALETGVDAGGQDACLEIVDAHCQRVAECRGDSYELCVTGVDQFCHAWRPEPSCVEDIWLSECEAEMPLPCSCGSGTPGC